MKRNVKVLALSIFILVMFVFPNVQRVQAFPWSQWYTAAVGDVSETELPQHWHILSEPKPGNENQLWDDWRDVTWSLWDQNSDLDKEIRVSTYDDQTYMGTLTFQSKGEFSGTDWIYLRSRVARKFTSSLVRTLGKIQVWDITSSSAAQEWVIQSEGTTLEWGYYTGEVSLNPTHTYALRIVFNDGWLYQKVEVIFEYVEVWGFKTDSISWYHFEYWQHIYLWPWFHHYYISEWRVTHSFSQFDIIDMLRNHIPYGMDRDPPGSPTGWNPAYVFEFRVSPWDHVAFWGYLTDLPAPVSYGAEVDYGKNQYEVEVYTYNAEALQASTSYHVYVAFSILKTGQISMILESELANEADRSARLSPPGYPVAYLTQGTDEADYPYCYWKEFRPLGRMMSNHASVNTPTNSLENNSIYPIVHSYQDYQYYTTAVVEYDDYAKVIVHLKLKSYEELSSYLEEINTLEQANTTNKTITTTITFSRLLSNDELESFMKTYDLDVQAFRFQGDNNGQEINGGCLPLVDDVIPIDQILNFMSPAQFKGFYRVDAQLKTNQIKDICKLPYVLHLDLSGQFALDGVNIHDKPVIFIVDDPFWLV